MKLNSLNPYLKSTLSWSDWTSKSRIFLSLYNDPCINLSIENYIFKNTPSEDHKLCFYINNPCVVIGRNQNPWRECNLPLMNSLNIPLVRRRSGGGTVVHDKGNVNFSVMIPRDEFTRDKHAQMIIDAMNELGPVVQHPGVSEEDASDELHPSFSSPSFAPLSGPQIKLKLNERYDIVTKENRKVSGSAYKIERQRTYHHGTMLLNSRLDTLSALLHRDISRLGVVEGRGVASVKSPVSNIGCDSNVFISSVVKAFQRMYYSDDTPVAVIDDSTTIPQSIIEEAENMKTWDWKFGQTPEFTHSMKHPETDMPVEFTVNKGRIVKVKGVSGDFEGVRYNSDELSRLTDQTWIMRAIDGFSNEKVPGMDA